MPLQSFYGDFITCIKHYSRKINEELINYQSSYFTIFLLDLFLATSQYRQNLQTKLDCFS